MRAKIARQPWGLIQDDEGNVQASVPVTLTTHDGEPAIVFANALTETTTTPTTNARGEIQGWITPGRYLLSVGDLEDEEVEALPGPKFVPQTGGGVGVEARDAIQLALNRAAEEPFSTVELPEGLFELRTYYAAFADPNSTLFIWPSTRLRGQGVDRTTIRQCMDSPSDPALPATSVLRAGSTASVVAGNAGIEVEDLTIDGNKDNVLRGNGATLFGLVDFAIRRVKFINCANNGIVLTSARYGEVEDVSGANISSVAEAEWSGVDTSTGHLIVTNKSSDEWCHDIHFKNIRGKDVLHCTMRLSSIHDFTVNGLLHEGEATSPFTICELAADFAPEDTTMVLESANGAVQVNGSLVQIDGDGQRWQFDTITGDTLTGVETESTTEAERTDTYLAGAEVIIGRTSGYGGLRFSNGSHNGVCSDVVIRGSRRGIHWTAGAGENEAAHDITVNGATIEDCAYQGFLMNGWGNKLLGLTLKNCCVYADVAGGEDASDGDTSVVDSTGGRLAGATGCVVRGRIVDDRDPMLHDYGIRSTDGDANEIAVRFEGYNIAPLHTDGPDDDVSGSSCDGSEEKASGAAIPIPLTKEWVTLTGTDEVLALFSDTAGLSIVSASGDEITLDASASQIAAPGSRLIVGTGVSHEVAVVDSVAGNVVTLTAPLDNAHSAGEGVYPVRWPKGHRFKVRSDDAPTLHPGPGLDLTEEWTPTDADDWIELAGDRDGYGLIETGRRGLATLAALEAHTEDDALDGGPHGLPALTPGATWMNVGGVLEAQNVAPLGEFQGHLAVYRNVKAEAHRLTASIAGAAATYVWGTGVPVVSTDNTSGLHVFPFDPADYAIFGYTTTCRMRFMVSVDDTAPGVTFTAGLYPVTAITGGASAAIATLGTVVSGSTAVFTTPAANADLHSVSSTFTAPSAGRYVFGVAVSGAMAANSAIVIYGALQVKHT